MHSGNTLIDSPPYAQRGQIHRDDERGFRDSMLVLSARLVFVA